MNKHPKQEIFYRLYKDIDNEIKINPNLPKHPTYLILSGWNYSEDWEKAARWEELIAWAKENKLDNIIPDLTESDYD
jgi:hypothetical protein